MNIEEALMDITPLEDIIEHYATTLSICQTNQSKDTSEFYNTVLNTYATIVYNAMMAEFEAYLNKRFCDIPTALIDYPIVYPMSPNRLINTRHEDFQYYIMQQLFKNYRDTVTLIDEVVHPKEIGTVYDKVTGEHIEFHYRARNKFTYKVSITPRSS